MQEWWVNMNRNGGSTWSGIYIKPIPIIVGLNIRWTSDLNNNCKNTLNLTFKMDELFNDTISYFLVLLNNWF